MSETETFQKKRSWPKKKNPLDHISCELPGQEKIRKRIEGLGLRIDYWRDLVKGTLAIVGPKTVTPLILLQGELEKFDFIVKSRGGIRKKESFSLGLDRLSYEIASLRQYGKSEKLMHKAIRRYLEYFENFESERIERPDLAYIDDLQVNLSDFYQMLNGLLSFFNKKSSNPKLDA